MNKYVRVSRKFIVKKKDVCSRKKIHRIFLLDIKIYYKIIVSKDLMYSFMSRHRPVEQNRKSLNKPKCTGNLEYDSDGISS